MVRWIICPNLVEIGLLEVIKVDIWALLSLYTLLKGYITKTANFQGRDLIFVLWAYLGPNIKIKKIRLFWSKNGRKTA